MQFVITDTVRNLYMRSFFFFMESNLPKLPNESFYAEAYLEGDIIAPVFSPCINIICPPSDEME